MLRRSVLGLKQVSRIPTRARTQIPSHLFARKDFSAATKNNASGEPGAPGDPSGSGSTMTKAVIGSLALGFAGIAAYQTGYLDSFLVNEQNSTHGKEAGGADQRLQVSSEQPQKSETAEHLKDTSDVNSLSKSEDDSKLQAALPLGSNQPDVSSNLDHKLASSSQSSEATVPGSTNNVTQVEKNQHSESPEVDPVIQNKPIDTAVKVTHANEVPKEVELNTPQQQIHITALEDNAGNSKEQSSTLLNEYHLLDNTEEASATSHSELKDLDREVKVLTDSHGIKDGQLIFDFLQAIHAAENRQAALDAKKFGEEKRIMKEKYEKELRDAIARELMYAEREAILDKELNKEKVKAAAALKSLQEQLEEQLKTELEQKEAETAQELKKLEELGKAEVASAIASEKASQIEKMAEADLNIRALCMAFYARSEEARQSHSIYKLTVGALAIQDALSKGLPIQKEINALHTCLEGIEKDSLLDVVLSSFPEETRTCGTDTLLQLNQKFDALKGTLRHFSLIPPGGGGILVHSLASVASLLKVKEADQSGDGIESLINRVESFLADGKLLEAADTLEDGLKGSEASGVVADWVQKARNRAITEQSLSLLHSYATAASLA
ncbi:Mitochondrial inner membrane protein Mitofilin [Heracleum sosnowskyi]|uniref:Mitochondrial inner membrane protein Mitofilin n=1 Tax=Heracleum sosnowskyi TaxID=360622 RepID=A0AAD8MG96_9APIA|nr:Mitochondrial inner membrane protein Mitofilin [Heracleum sosnowskyi]